MLSRMLGMLYLLMSKGTVTAGELAERFEVSTRTVYRDVEALSMAGIPVYARKGKNGGISLMEQFVLDKMLISEEEQGQILAALASLRETGAGAQKEEETLRKLGDFFRAEPESWVSIDFSDWSGSRRELFEGLRLAILKRRVLRFDYYGQYGEMTGREAEPVQLLFKEYTWYLRAYCRVRKAMRLFKVLRMKRVEILEETFVPDREWLQGAGTDLPCEKAAEPGTGEFSAGAGGLGIEGPAGKDGDAAGKAFCTEGEVPGPEDFSGRAGASERMESEEITVWIDKREAYRVYDRFGEDEITVLPEGDFLIRMRSILDDWVYGMLLSFGPSAKVLAPERVRDGMVRRIREMEEVYGAGRKL